MANYINKNILCQAYIHVEEKDSINASIDEIKKHLTEFAESRARFFLYEGIEIEVIDKPGSKKVVITVLGIIAVLYHSVAEYKDFREGAIQLYDDCKRLSEYLISEGLFSTKSRHSDVFRLEARVGIIGSIRKVIYYVDSVKDWNGRLTGKAMATKISVTCDSINKILDNVQGDQDKAFVKAGLKNIVSTLPKKPGDLPKRKQSQEHLNLYEHELTRINNLLS